MRVATSGVGTVPLLAERLLKELRKPQNDWRTILADFVQEDITDYSFSPPDRRFPDSPFFLPDFNEKEERLENILFMIDTSGSMSDDMITAAYSEVLGAIEQFDGKLSGYLGFFDAEITEPAPFTSLEEFRVIRPRGGRRHKLYADLPLCNRKRARKAARQHYYTDRRLCPLSR